MKPGMPDFSFDNDADPGGYIYWGLHELTIFGGTITEDDMPYCAHSNKSTMWLLVKVYGTPPILPLQSWNCTAKDLVLAAKDFTGLINNVKICNVGECCSGLYDKPKYGDDQLAWHSWANDRAASGLCDAPQTEEMYCISVGGHFHTNCYEYYPTPDTRLWNWPCYDNAILYWMTCAVFRQAYAFQYAIGSQDSPIHQNSLSNEEGLTFDGMFSLHDRVCNPYSYYFPDTAGGGGGGDGGKDSKDSKDSSPAAFSSFVVATVFFLFN